MYTHSRHSVTNSHGYVRHAEIKDNSVLPGGEQRGLFLYSLSELLEIQGGGNSPYDWTPLPYKSILLCCAIHSQKQCAGNG